MIGLIVGVSIDGVIGVDGGLPWRYRGDLKRFKKVTMGSTIVMGRKTWDSIGGKALPGRRNVVISRRAQDFAGADCFQDVRAAIASATKEGGDVWVIGGAQIFAEALPLADVVDVTLIPVTVGREDAVRFAPLSSKDWDEGPLLPHEEDPALKRRVYTRRR